MAFDFEELKARIELSKSVIRVVVIQVEGSAPRGVGASMLVWKDGQSGTIGGGALEYKALKSARKALISKLSWISSHPLGPELGQCCGGFVKLAGEYFDKKCFPSFEDGFYIRLIPADNSKVIPVSVRRELWLARDEGKNFEAAFYDGWFVEPLAEKKMPLWIWGAGHVGRALVAVMCELPNIDITWIDTAADRFPKVISPHVTTMYSDIPQRLVKYSPSLASHVILTYSHDLDFEICHSLLQHEFEYAGLIGSKTKWSRFKKRLKAIGNEETRINRITCPIGRPEFGKHPQQIAIGVAEAFLVQQGNQKIVRGDWNEQHPIKIGRAD